MLDQLLVELMRLVFEAAFQGHTWADNPIIYGAAVDASGDLLLSPNNLINVRLEVRKSLTRTRAVCRRLRDELQDVSSLPGEAESSSPSARA